MRRKVTILFAVTLLTSAVIVSCLRVAMINAQALNDLVRQLDFEGHHFVIARLENPDQVCLKSHIGLADEIGAKNDNGSLKRDFIDSSFTRLVSDKNATLNGFKPIAAINTDFVDGTTNGPMSINFIKGNDYSGWRDWTSVAISRDNQISFVREKPTNAYNVSGGGPLIYAENGYIDQCANLGQYSCTRPERSILAITKDDKLVLLVSSTLSLTDIVPLIQRFVILNSLGDIKNISMFDGGASPSMMYRGRIVREGYGRVSSALLIFTGQACQYR